MFQAAAGTASIACDLLGRVFTQALLLGAQQTGTIVLSVGSGSRVRPHVWRAT
jgi:hypothetical protein